MYSGSYWCWDEGTVKAADEYDSQDGRTCCWISECESEPGQNQTIKLELLKSMTEHPVSITAEDYLKAVLRLEDRNEKVSTSKVARHLDVNDSTVTDMLRKLQSAGLLEYTPYYGASLTPRGRGIALRILRRHRLIELCLHQIMGYGWEQVHEEAEKLEHVVSDFFVERIDALLDHPIKDPHGEVIPDITGFREADNDTCLALAGPGDYSIRKVIDSSPELLTYLEKESLTPGRVLSLLEKSPFQGPLKLLLREANSRSTSALRWRSGFSYLRRNYLQPQNSLHVKVHLASGRIPQGGSEFKSKPPQVFPGRRIQTLSARMVTKIAVGGFPLRMRPNRNVQRLPT